jgi:hypothetical protein
VQLVTLKSQAAVDNSASACAMRAGRVGDLMYVGAGLVVANVEPPFRTSLGGVVGDVAATCPIYEIPSARGGVMRLAQKSGKPTFTVVSAAHCRWVRCGSIASVEQCLWHVGFAPDSRRYCCAAANCRNGPSADIGGRQMHISRNSGGTCELTWAKADLFGACRGPHNMADQRSLQFIGWMFGAVTAAVMFVATMAIVNVDQDFGDQPTRALVSYAR